PTRPAFIEGQLPAWAISFARRDGVPSDPFKGRRGQLLHQAMRVRRLAERAAADERIGRWVMPLVEAGDDLRRQAQDDLFAGTAEQFEQAHALLERAAGFYTQALEG